jgi:Sec-independent protein translocase protein TatA
MFGVGIQELLVIGLLLLVVFGPARAGQMARDLGKFAYGARRSMETFKAELTDVDSPNRGKENKKEEPQKIAEEG